MKFTEKDFLKKIPQGDLRAVARLITLSENRSPRARSVLAKLYADSGKAHVIGVTGSPGAGKSTLVDHLAKYWTEQGKKVGILAIDPTSPFSGGAILGDRIRMNLATELPGVFVRSMATRGSLGGLSSGAYDAIQILDAAGFDIVLVETVGVGQAEVDIVRTADTCIVVLVPGMGDSVQAFKAGILEIADVFVVNKADRDGADLVQRDLRVLISLGEYEEKDWTPPIERTVATTGEGTAELAQSVTKHAEWLGSSAAGAERRKNIVKSTIVRLATGIIYENVVDREQEMLDALVQDCFERKLDPYTAVEQLVQKTVKTL